MRDEGVVLLGKPIDNSRVVREVDPRSRREIWLLILLVAVLVPALGRAKQKAARISCVCHLKQIGLAFRMSFCG